MKKILIVVISGILIASLGYFLRVQKFDAFPPTGDTYDELKGVFNGVSLITEGKPRSWSWFDAYGNFPVIHVRNADFRLVEPWFEEPPLFSLMAGAYAISKGMNTLEKIDIGAMRWPMIKLAAVNIFLLFILVYLVRGPIEAVFASLIYATVPTFVLGSRLPISENMITTAMLLSLILFTIFIKNPKTIYNYFFLCITGLIGSSAFLMKQTGVFVPITLIILAFSLKNMRAGLIFIGCFILVFFLWIGYGYYYNWNLFVQMLFTQSGRELFNPSNIINLFEVFRIGESAMSVDGWILWGWIAVVIYSFVKYEDKTLLQKLILPISLGSYLVFFNIMSGHSKGWYRFPFYPFLSWVSAAIFLSILRNPRFLLTLFFIGIPVSSSYIW